MENIGGTNPQRHVLSNGPDLMCAPPSVIDVTSLLQRALHIDTQAAKNAENALANKNDNGLFTTQINLVDTFREPTKQHKKKYQQILRRLMKERARALQRQPLYGSPFPQRTTATLVKSLEELRILNASLPDQRTTEWYVLRQNCISASEGYKVLGNPKPVSTFAYEKASTIRHPERQTHRDTPPTMNNARDWGVVCEPICEKIYSNLLRPGAVVEEFGSLPHPTIPFLRASPDGICNERSTQPDAVGTMVEFKAPYSRPLKKACIKDEYLAQMQLQLEVAGLNKCDFLECVLELIGKDDAQRGFHPVPTTFRTASTRPLTTHAIGYIVSFPDCPSSKFLYGQLNDVDKASVHASIALLECTEEQRACAVVHYWRLKQYQLITVYRNQAWFNATMLPKLTSVWARIEALVADDEAYEIERSTRAQTKANRRSNKTVVYAFRGA